MTDAPLRGIRVADFSRILAGPLCTMILGDLGADIVKVERPGDGDDTRSWGPPFVEGDAAYFLSVNRNKRSVALDLRDPDDAAAARDLIRTSDVVIENFRTGVMARFGLGYETVHRLNPAVVYCSIPAFSDPELSERPGYDLMMQAYSGFMSITGQADAPPVKVGVAVLDVIAGLYAAVGILAALRAREETGEGDKVTVSLFDASVAALVNQATNYLVGGTLPRRTGNAHPNIVPYEVFATSDRPLALAAGNDKLFRMTCEVLGTPELVDDPRFRTNAARVEHRDELVTIMAAAFRRRPLAHWLAVLGDRGVPCGPVRGIDEVFSSPEGQAMIQQIDDPVRGALRLVASPLLFGVGPDSHRSTVGRPPPRLDEHGEEIRAELAPTALTEGGTPT
jgi:crotonobetainyl-CoA:carnitine CoA-transferase CaiB-like acyl-CoA transferase